MPVVHATGGLADTVVNVTDQSLESGVATGFSFDNYSVDSLERSLQEALDFYYQRLQQWASIVETGMRNDWSWTNSARRYLEVYHETLQSRNR